MTITSNVLVPCCFQPPVTSYSNSILTRCHETLREGRSLLQHPTLGVVGLHQAASLRLVPSSFSDLASVPTSEAHGHLSGSEVHGTPSPGLVQENMSSLLSLFLLSSAWLLSLEPLGKPGSGKGVKP